jgi:acetate kinase
MNNGILAINAGSSSVKCALFAIQSDGKSLSQVYRGGIESIGHQPHLLIETNKGQQLVDRQLSADLSYDDALTSLLDWIEQPDNNEATVKLQAIGHRVVHGGSLFSAPVRIDAHVIEQLEQLTPLAPLHQPHNIAAIHALARARPDLPQVACFDTAFHNTQPAVAQAFALPREITDRGIKRYGFHGISYEYIASILPDVIGDKADGRVVVAHLGNGASMCAMHHRASIATTMGLTALDGLPMGTRCGSLDPGVILYLLSELHMDAGGVTDLLYHRSGLLGVSGESSDMRDLMASKSPRAAAAIDLFVYHIGRELGSLAAALGGLDALVFTGGIGEHAVSIRTRVCRDARWLGIQLDEAANNNGGPRISGASSAVSAWVIPTDEDTMIARHTNEIVSLRRA